MKKEHGQEISLIAHLRATCVYSILIFSTYYYTFESHDKSQHSKYDSKRYDIVFTYLHIGRFSFKYLQ